MAVLQGQKLSFAGYDGWEKESLRDEEHPFLPYNITEPRVIKGYPEKFQVSGRMIGGCMDCLVNLIGMLANSLRDIRMMDLSGSSSPVI